MALGWRSDIPSTDRAVGTYGVQQTSCCIERHAIDSRADISGDVRGRWHANRAFGGVRPNSEIVIPCDGCELVPIKVNDTGDAGLMRRSLDALDLSACDVHDRKLS